MAEPGIGVSGFNDLDTRFHVLRALEAAEDCPATARALNAEDGALLALVREGKGAETADLVEQHIRELHGTLVEGSIAP